jgi:hypothetical protein
MGRTVSPARSQTGRKQVGQGSIHLPSWVIFVPESFLILVLLLHPRPMSLDYAADSESGVDRIFNSIINVAACSDSSSSGDTVNNSVVFACLADLTADSLGFAVLGKSCSSGEVTKAIDTLELLVTVGGRLQVLNKCVDVLDTLATRC